MKTGSLLAVAGLVICFAAPAFAQQRSAADSEMVLQRDLLGVVKATDNF
jgi:hypothetical protein